MAEESQQDQRATRRGVLLGVGLAGFGGVLAGCSTAVVPYGANEDGTGPGQGPGQASASSAPSMAGTPANAGTPAHQGKPAGAAGGKANGTLLGLVKDIPLGGGMIFASQKVVVTQPARGVLKAFSTVCTHMGCEVDKIASGTIDCPCHGSEFTISDGAVAAGPAPAPLPAVTITVSDGKILLQ